MSYNPMNPSEAEKHLRKSLLAVITGSSCTYQEAMSAIGYVQCTLREKGDNLLKDTPVLDVARVEEPKHIGYA